LERDGRGLLVRARDSLGRTADYERFPDGRIASVTDFTGRKVTFGYDGAGNLTSVTSPAVLEDPAGATFPEGVRREYRYSSGFADERLNHNLTEVIDPREAASTRLPRVTIAYGEDPASTAFDRVVAQAIGGTNATGVAAGGTARFEYEGGGEPLDDASTAAGLESMLLAVAGLTRYTDPEGRVTEVLSSGAGLPLSVKLHTVEGLRPRDPTRLHPPPGVAPPFYETRFRWTREGLLASRMGPRGDRVDLAYDEGAPLRHAQAALLRREHHPAPQATAPGAPPAPPAVSLFKVDPLFAVAVEETAPGGGVTRRFLDYQEGAALEDLAREAGAEPADLEAALARAGVELGLGDLNGDGVTAQRRGNVVREVPPPATRPDGSVDASYSTFAYNELGQLTSTVDGSARAVRLEYHPAADPDGDGVPSAAEGQDAATGGFLARRIVDLGSAGENRGDLVLASYAYDPRGYLASAKDGNGNETFYFHDALGRLTEVRLAPPLRYRWHRVHDADGNVAAFRVENYTSTDRGGHFLVSANRFIDVEVDRDLLGRPVAVRREVSEGEVGPARSIERRYRYGPAGGLVRIVGPVTGRDEAFLLDERGLPLRRTLAAGTPDEAAVTTLRDEDGSVVLQTDAADSDGDGQPETTEHHHDGFGRLAATIDPAGGTRVLERDVEGRVVAESFLGLPGGPTPRDRSGAGNVLLGRTCFRHDERGRLVERQRWLFGRDEPARALVETYHLDGAGRVEKRVDPDGGVWTWDHDGAGRMQRETDPLGGTLTVRYDGNGNPVREAREAFTLEPVGPAASGDPDYDEAGRFREVSVIVRAFDPLDRLTVLVDPAGGVWRMRYDSMSNRILVSDATGTPIRPETDPELAPLLDLLTEKQRSSLNDHGNRRRYVYDNLGRLVEAIHELRKEGRGGGEIDPTNPFNSDGRIAERFEWDDEGWLWAWTDDAGNRTELQRDGAGHPRTKVWPDGTAQSFETDRDGNPTAIADENGTVVRQRFDALGRLVERRIERAASVEGTTLQRFEHDGLSRVTLCFDDNRPEDPLDDALVCRRQDSLGGLLEEVQGTSSVEAGLDPASRVVSLRYPGGLRVETPRDRAGRIASLSDARRTFTAYRRFGSGLLLEKRLASGLTASFLRPDEAGVPRMRGYDPAGEVEEIAYRNAAGETMHGFEYGRDRSGHKLYEKLLHRLDGLGDAWQLDSAYRIFRYLPNVFDPRFPPVDPVEKLVYYADGNHSWRFLEVNFSVRRVEVNARSAYVSSDGDRFEYDARGSLRKAGELSFAYDALGRLARASRGTRDVALYRYDAARAEDPWAFLGKGRRVAKDVLQPVRGQPAGVVRFAYWGESVIEERDGAGQLLRQYLLEDDGRPAVLLDHVEAGPGKPYGLLHDACGSLTGIADPTGAVVETVRYGVHGQPRVFNSFGSPIQFSELGVALGFGGLQHDFELGFHLAGARHFDPSLARHLSEATPLTPRAPLEMNGYQLPGIPGLNGEVSGRESRRRAAPYLEPFRVRVGERAAPREPKLPAPPNTSPLTGS
ncbi:MAG: RHS repeat protein, partial [Planctomycetes bacterium]|nr:RHS repeat protein [Planctomycetota bacterium]